MGGAVVGDKTLGEWINAPYGEFHKKCKELGIRLCYGDDATEDLEFEVCLRYEFSGYGYKTIKITAFSEEEAEKIALEYTDFEDFYNCDINDVSVDDITEIP